MSTATLIQCETREQCKTCAACKQAKALAEFNKLARSPDGLQAYCRECQAAKRRDWYHEQGGRQIKRQWQVSESGKQSHRQSAARHRQRHPQKIRARNAVNHAIARGELPPPADCLCACGQPAVHYHHHKGYADEAMLDVVPLCDPCHKAADAGGVS